MAFGALRGTLSGTGQDVVNPNQATGSVAVSVGDLVYAVFVQQGAVTVTTATDNLGHSYTFGTGGDAGNVTGRACFTRITTAGTLTAIDFTASESVANWIAIAAVIEGPIPASSPVDSNQAPITSDVTSPLTCPATGTLSQATEVVLCFGAANQNAAWTASSPNLLAIEVANLTNLKAAIGYQAVASTSSVAPEFTVGSNPTECVLATTSFKADSVVTLSPPLYSDGDSFPAPTVTASAALAPSLYSDADSFAAAIAAGNYPLAAALYADSDTFPASAVTGHYPLAAALFSDGDTFSPPVVETSGALQPALYTDDDSFPGAAAASTYALAADLLTDSDTFPAAALSAVTTIAASLYSDGDTFHAAAASANNVLSPPMLGNGNAFPAPALAATYAVSPSLFSDGDVFHAATVATAGGLLPALFTDGDTFHAAAVGGNYALLADPVASATTFYALTIGAPITVSIRAAFLPQTTAEVWAVLLTIDHQDLAAPVRLTSDVVGTISRGNLYDSRGVRATLPPQQPGRIGTAQIEFEDVAGTLDRLLGPPSPWRLMTITVELIFLSAPDTVQKQMAGIVTAGPTWEAGILGMEVAPSLTYNELGGSVYFNQAFPGLH